VFAEVHSVEEKMEVPVGRGSWESSLLGDPSAKFLPEKRAAATKRKKCMFTAGEENRE
jgi:hypothetical protein